MTKNNFVIIHQQNIQTLAILLYMAVNEAFSCITSEIFLISGILRMWDVRDVGCLGCRIFGI